MYLTDFRERPLRDVITQLEPQLFKKITGLTVNNFSLLEKLGVLNSARMNDAVFKFKRYEDTNRDNNPHLILKKIKLIITSTYLQTLI